MGKFSTNERFFPLRQLYYILECNAISHARNRFIDETLILKKTHTQANLNYFTLGEKGIYEVK